MNPGHGWTDYQQRLGRVIAYLHDHLDEPLDLHRLAEVAHLSPYHWHRVYHALHGETIAVTVRRLRLHRATGYLANTSLPVEQLARRCGYPNAQSFSRAFRAAYGMSPLQYRQHGGHVAFRAAQADRRMPAGYEVAVREIPRVRLLGLNHKGSYMAIGKAFEPCFVQLAALGQVRADTRWIAEYLDDPSAVPEHQLCARAGLSVPEGVEAVPPLVAFEVGGMPCAVLRHRGPYATMRAAYQWLYGHWLEYLNNPPNTAPADLLTDICLPLARSHRN